MPESDIADVVVIGAGPAGSALAMTAARGGAKVVVLEKSSFPRDKTCGDGLGLDCYQELEKLGVMDEVRAAARSSIRGVRLSGPAGQEVELTTLDHTLPGFADHTFCVPRRVLDHLLVERAVAAGARLRERCTVREVLSDQHGRVTGVRCTDGSEVRGRLVAGCGGEHDPLARVMGRPRDPRRKAFGIRAYFAGLPEPMPVAHISFAEFVLPGYGWIFPVGPDRANVGVGLRSDLLARRGGDLRGIFRRFVAEDPAARRWLAGARQETPALGWPLTFGSQAARSTGPGWLLCGDAACLINPVTGEGIGNALQSGRLAAEAVLACDGDPGGLSTYERAWRRAMGGGFRAGHHVQNLLTHSWVVNRVIKQAARRHDLGTEIAAIVSGAHSNERAFAASTLFRLAF